MMVWFLYFRNDQRTAEEVNKFVQGRVSTLRNAENELAKTRTQRAAVQAQAEDLRRLIARRTDGVRILNGIRDSLVEGMWLTHVEPMRDAAGQVVRVKLMGYGFKDRLVLAVKEAGGKGTPGELLRDRLQNHREVFGEVTIQNDRDSVKEQYLREFTVEAALAPAAR